MGYNTIENPQLLCQCSGYCAIEGGGGLLAHGVSCRKGHPIYPPADTGVSPAYAMVPCAQYDALMGAVRAAEAFYRSQGYQKSYDRYAIELGDALITLRAAGIQEEK